MNSCSFRQQWSLFFVTCLALVVMEALSIAAEPWSADMGHNHVKAASNLPTVFDESTRIWKVDTVTKFQFPMPLIVGDKALVGSPGAGNPDPFHSRGAALTAYNLKDGSVAWRLMVLPNGGGRNAYGLCGVPAIVGDRAYVLANFDVVCVDLNGLADGNDGMQSELQWLNSRQQRGDGERIDELPEWAADIIWSYDLTQHDVQVQDSSSCSVVLTDGQVWVATAQELGSRARAYKAEKNVPHMVVLDQETGALIARDQMEVPLVFHGEWSSPSLLEVNGQRTVVFPDGYGVVHAFKIPEPSADGTPVILEEYWTFDMNPPEFRYLPDGREIVYTLDERLDYKYPEDYFTNAEKYFLFGKVKLGDEKIEELKWANKPAQLAKGKHETVTGPSEVISMPAVVGNRIYLGMGRDRAYGLGNGKGRFVCLEVNDVATTPTVLWEDREVGRTQSTASIVDGLCYVADGYGKLNCWDAETGEVVYRFELDKHAIRERSQMVADGKIYICDERKQMKVIKAGREPELISESRLKTDAATIDAVDGLVLVVTHRSVELYGDKSALPE